MSVSFSIAVYFIIWWLVLFAVLPFGVRTQGEADSTVPGTPASAPAAHRMKRTALITTVVSAVLFALLYLTLTRKWISLDAIPILRG
jgi:predicted secreted protein